MAQCSKIGYIQVSHFGTLEKAFFGPILVNFMAILGHFKACQTGLMVPSMVGDVVLVPKNHDKVSWDHSKPK